MCTAIASTVRLDAAAKGHPGWFPVTQATVAYDHPVRVGLEHAFLLDFANYDLGLQARVAVEMDLPAARSLLKELAAAIEAVESSGLAGEPAPTATGA